jgi:hypothetical protein
VRQIACDFEVGSAVDDTRKCLEVFRNFIDMRLEIAVQSLRKAHRLDIRDPLGSQLKELLVSTVEPTGAEMLWREMQLEGAVLAAIVFVLAYPPS